MKNRIRDLEKFKMTSSAHCVESHIDWLERGAYWFDAPYQRAYVWKKKQQQEFLTTLVSGFPLGSIAIAKHDDWARKDGPWLEVVDGKQRLMTIQKFIFGEIPLQLPAGDVYWHDLERGEKRSFGRAPLPLITLFEATDKMTIDYFIAVNFTGLPQSNNHKLNVLKMRGEM